MHSLAHAFAKTTSQELEVSEQRFFIPVCLYPHTKYRSRSGLADLIERFDLTEHNHLVVVADHLLALDNLVTGRFWNPDLVFEKAHRESMQVYRHILRTAKRTGSSSRLELRYWDDVAAVPTFQQYAERVDKECRESAAFMAEINKFVEARIVRFVAGEANDRHYKAETAYIFSEITMSIYCTEILGYSTEVWEKPLKKGAPDPLGILYRQYPSIVHAISKKSVLDRNLKHLYGEGC